MKTITTAIAASFAASLTAILATTAIAWAEPSPPLLTYSQLANVVQHADEDPHAVPGFVGAHLTLDLRPSAIRPYFIAAGSAHGMAFTCQPEFDGFAGGPITATLVSYAPGEDGRDFVNLTGCTPQER